jgi:hypothetical protein
VLNELLALPLETQIFVTLIFAIAIFFHRRFDAKTAANGPTILTTVGIFATFLAIALGLKNFDSANIQNSIPDLLNNLKTAFWASVAGVGAALTLKGREHVWGHSVPKDEQQAPDEVGAVEIVKGLGRVEHALVGGEEGSLISQVKLLRNESRDELRRLGDAQAKALEKLSELGSKTLIEALKDVIRDFNKNLTEQFGENFKELNAAVVKLVLWQEQYRLHVEDTTKKLGEMQSAFERTAADYANVVEKSMAFAKVSEDIGLVVQEMDVRHKMLVGQNEALANLLREASGALPEIEKKMVELARQLADGMAENRRVLDDALNAHVATIQSGAQAASEGIKKASDESVQAMARIAASANDHLATAAKQLQDRSDENQKAISRAMQEHATAFAASIKTSVDSAIAVAADQGKRLMDATEKTQSEVIAHAKELSRSLAESQQTTAKTMVEGAESLRQSMQSTVEAMVASNNAQNQQLAELASKTKEQVVTLDAQLREELNNSLASLGQQLTTLSARFVQDYQPLTDSLARFIEAAKRGANQ